MDDRFKKVLRIKNNAISIFEEAKAGLNKAVEKLYTHQAEAKKRIEEHETEIHKEMDAHSFAEQEIQSAKKTIEKIEAILN